MVHRRPGIEVSLSDGFLTDGATSIVDEEIDLAADSLDEVGDRLVARHVAYYGLPTDLGGEWLDALDSAGCTDDVPAIAR